MWHLRNDNNDNERTAILSAENLRQALKGTTTVGICVKDGVVVVTDRRATMGYLIASKQAIKVFKLDEFIAATIAGLVADAQQLMDIAKAEFALYYMNHEKHIPIRSAARLLGNLLFSQRGAPMLIQCILAGIDASGPHLFSLDPLGSIIEDSDFVSTGSGSPIAYGILEDSYNANISLSEGILLGLRSLKAAMARDAGSGNGYNVATVSKIEGCKIFSDNEINDYLIKINNN